MKKSKRNFKKQKKIAPGQETHDISKPHMGEFPHNIFLQAAHFHLTRKNDPQQDTHEEKCMETIPTKKEIYWSQVGS